MDERIYRHHKSGTAGNPIELRNLHRHALPFSGAVRLAVPSVAGLSALDIDPEAAAQDNRDRVIGPYRGALPADAVAGMEEQHSGACTVEVAAFDEFTG